MLHVEVVRETQRPMRVRVVLWVALFTDSCYLGLIERLGIKFLNTPESVCRKLLELYSAF
jgi:hypothetical protein